jgi:hypothetical protein
MDTVLKKIQVVDILFGHVLPEVFRNIDGNLESTNIYCRIS